MDWIFVGVILNSIVTSGFSSEEACLGHKAMMEKQKIIGVCVDASSLRTGTNSVFIGNSAVPMWCLETNGTTKLC